MSITKSVIEDLKNREKKGIETYGRTLTVFNGRNSLQDAYEEELDKIQYMKQWIEEREILIDFIKKVAYNYTPKLNNEAIYILGTVGAT